jgi:carbonic anhydrase
MSGADLPLPVKKDPRYKDHLIEIVDRDDIPLELRDSPVEALIMCLNFGWPVPQSSKPQLLVSTCIEFRFSLPMPRMHSYVIRRASGRLVGSEFTVGYCMSQGVSHVAMIGHNDCGMTRASQSASKLVDSYVNQGWSRKAAQDFVDRQLSRYHMKDELSGLEEEYERLRTIFKKLVIAPLFVSLYDSRLYLPKFYVESLSQSSYANYNVPDELIAKL